MADMEDILDDAATAPKRVTVDGTSAEGQSVSDLIALDKHQAGRGVRDNPAGAITRCKLVPPGTA